MYQDRSETLRSRRRVIEQATHILAEGRGRTMQEIADESGVGRTTLYRHFHTREDLINAIKVQALEEAGAAIVASRIDEGDAEDALRRLIAEMMAVGDRYRFLFLEGLPKHEEKSEHADHATPLFRLIERGQREGAFSSNMSARWILTAMSNLLLAAIRQVQEGDLARNHAAAMVSDTLLCGIRARRAEV